MDVDDSSSLSSVPDHESDEASPPPTAAATAATAAATTATSDVSQSGTAGNRRRSSRVSKKVQAYSPPPLKKSTRKPKRKHNVIEEIGVDVEVTSDTEDATHVGDWNYGTSAPLINGGAKNGGNTAPSRPGTIRGNRKVGRDKDGSDDNDNDDDGDDGDGDGDEDEDEDDGDGDDDDDDDGDDDDDETVSEDESEGEPDEEELKEFRKKARAAGRGGRAAGRGRGRPVAVPFARGGHTAKKFKTVTGEAAPAPASAQAPVPVPRRAQARSRAHPYPKVRNKGKAKDKGKGAESKPANGDASGVSPATPGLYGAVFGSSVHTDDVARRWITVHHREPSDGMRDMINFILKCCGCDLQVTAYDVENQDSVSSTLTDIQDAFATQHVGDYPLSSKKPIFRTFRQTLSKFLEAVVALSVFPSLRPPDKEMLENLQTWIGAMSSSTLRQFRHTATVFALELVSHLAKEARKIRQAVSHTNRQLEAEARRKALNDARMKSLSTKLLACESMRDQVEGLIKDIFDTVFVHRYRDVDPKIRIDCIQGLSDWISVLPEVFFDGTYIRYLGWVLSDTVHATRLEVIRALAKLFSVRDHVAGLRHFTERFRDRLVEMATRDADVAVRAATVELLDVIREVGYLEPQDISTVGRLLFDSEKKVRRAVVPFFVQNINDLFQEKLEQLGGKEAVYEALGEDVETDYEGPTLSWIKLKCLAEALVYYDQAEENDVSNNNNNNNNSDGDFSSHHLLSDQSRGLVTKVEEIVSRFSLAGAVLWNTLDEVRDWESLTRYLLFDYSLSRTEEDEDSADSGGDVEKQITKVIALDSNEEVILLQVLNASLTGSIFKGPELPNKKKLQLRPTELEKHREIVSRGLTKYIPLLLRRFGPVPDAASAVLRLGLLMNLNVFQELRQTESYSSFLDELNRQFLTHSDEGVLKEIAAFLRHAKSFVDLDEVTDPKLAQLKDETVSPLGSAVRGKNVATTKFSAATLIQLISTVRKLGYLSSITDCVEVMEAPILVPPADSNQQPQHSTPLKPINILLDLLDREVSHDELERELMLGVFRAVNYYFMWKIAGLNRVDDDIDELDLERVLSRKELVFGRISTILEKHDQVDAIKTAAASTLLDLATLFISAPALRISSVTKPLEEGVQTQIMAVFDVLEKSFAKRSGKKLEPDEHAPPEDSADEDGGDGSDGGDGNGNDNDGGGGGANGDVDAIQSAQLVLEQRLCEFASKIILAVLSSAINQKTWRRRLARNQTRLGHNYKEVINYLDRASVGRPGTRRKARSKKVPAPASASAAAAAASASAAPAPTQKGSKRAPEVIDSDEEMEDNEEVEVEGAVDDDGMQEQDGLPEHAEDPLSEHAESEHSPEPDPEAEVPEDQDEDMLDV